MLISLNIPMTHYQKQERCIDNEFFVFSSFGREPIIKGYISKYLFFLYDTQCYRYYFHEI